YAEYVTAADYPDSFSYLNRENVIIMKTFSKIYGLAGLRVGFAFADANVVAHFEKIRSPFNVSSVAQAAAIAALADDDFIKMSKTKNHEVYEFFVSKASEAGFYCIPSQANFVMVDVKKDSRKVFESLMKKGFIVRPGAAFGMDTFLRVTLGTIEQMENFFPLLMKAVEEL
ncbi:MAG: aminotransferase class I/II-fold pyridoxal phosphate-dependent enzyme, partial [Clostridiales bacterium]|nr:aminotransferase class I/II-fold pyridoxal phosphate-dependent enzyme [Clostridiales bacterium]